MFRFASLVLILSGLAALAGCSVFGIATKSELEQALEQDAVRQQATDARLAGLDTELAASSETLAAAARQWEDLRASLMAHFDSLRTEYVTLDRDVNAVRQSMDAIGARAIQAEVNSRQAMQIQFETLVEQRDELLRQLDVLNLRLQTWPADADTAVAPDGVEAAAGLPASPPDRHLATPLLADRGGS